MTASDENIDTYKWTMTSLRMDKRFTCTYFMVMLSGNARKWFKALGPGSPLSRKMQGTVPKSRDEVKYRVEKYLRKIEGEERKEANLKFVLKAYLKQESVDSHSRHSHKERHDGSHDKHVRYSRHSSHRFCPFVKDEPLSHRPEIHIV
uniref:Retrotransposon gag domain-containing protein n=1 Tax=Lactuca sativa TaxID=4236 RepID=A0A9R1UZD0_LACSA|nr:hypothetical protein LSAT_V11C700368730 [Lactuca sativa]